MANCEKELWWYQCLHALTLSKIKIKYEHTNIKILDAGCGTGGMLAYLQKNNFSQLQGFDLSQHAVDYAASKHIPIIQLNVFDAPKRYSTHSFDVVICNDIIGHFDTGNDKKAIEGLLQLVKPGGLLLFNTASLNSFRGLHDIVLSVKQRYNKRKIRALVNNQNVTIRETQFWPFLLSPIIFCVRLLQRMISPFINKVKLNSDVKMPPAFLNKILLAITSWEIRTLKGMPWGSSLYVVIEKK
jgi:SAM-dependent methyltransferase